MAEMTPYAYRPGNGPIHRADAGLKLASLCALSFASFFGGIPGLAAATASAAVAAAIGGIPFPCLFAGSRPLAVATGLVVVLRTVRFDSGAPAFVSADAAGLAEGLVFAWGVFVSFAAGSVLFATTKTSELRIALARAERAAKRTLRALLPRRAAAKMEAADISLTIALALSFIPRVFAVWESAEDAHKARCGPAGFRALFSLVPLAAERLIEAAAETAHAMESRGYGSSAGID
jgi:biotin transport system permease protein